MLGWVGTLSVPSQLDPARAARIQLPARGPTGSGDYTVRMRDLNWGLLGGILFAALCWYLAFMAFTLPANAASAGGRPYRGYVTICVVTVERVCVQAQTRGLYDSEALCEAAVVAAVERYGLIVHARMPSASVSAQLRCRTEQNTYDA